MLTIRDPGWFRGGMAFCLLIFLCNHIDSLVRHQLEASHRVEGLNLSVQSEGGLFGHNSIGIDEASLSSGAERFLHFSTLGQWDFVREKQTRCPKPIQDLNGQKLSSVGFMYPLESGDTVKTFCLLRSTQTCCYGPHPQFNQYILVETKQPVAFERLAPILVQGTFYVDPKPVDGYIYRMEADAVRVVDEDSPEIDPVLAARQAHLPLFNYADLTEMAKTRTIPPALRALADRTVVLSGYMVKRRHGSPASLIVGKSWWDGVAQGDPPTLFNSVIVFPADSGQVPPLWKPLQVFTGTLIVNADSSAWRHQGIIQLKNARIGVPGITPVRATRTGLFVPWEIEALLLILVLIRSVRWRAHGSRPGKLAGAFMPK